MVENLSLIDSFDAVEQVLGHPLDLHGGHVRRQSRRCVGVMTYNFGGSAERDCPKRDISTSGGVITIDSVCNFNGATSTSHAVVSGDFNSAYTVEVTSKREGGRPIPGVAPGGEMHMMIAAKYVGPCAAGQRPGDIVMSNGMTMNVLDLQKGIPPRGAMPAGGAGRPPPPR